MNLLVGPLRLIPAGPGTPAKWVFRTLLQIIVFWGTFLFLMPWAIVLAEDALNLTQLRFTSGACEWIGGALFVVASSVGLWSGFTMAAQGDGTPLPAECARRLVVSGPYRFVRNPMAISGIAQGVAVGVYLGSIFVIAYALTGSIAWNTVARPAEEADLEVRFGDAYRGYRSSVRCWIPQFRAYYPAKSLDSDTGGVRRE